MQTGKNKRHRFQFSLRTLLTSVVLVTLLASYINSYYRLSRRGMKEAAEVEMEGFFYVTMDEMVDSIRRGERSSHYPLRILFLPANSIDHLIFGSPLALVHAPIMTL